MLTEKRQNIGRVMQGAISGNNLEEVFDTNIKVKNILKNLIILLK